MKGREEEGERVRGTLMRERHMTSCLLHTPWGGWEWGRGADLQLRHALPTGNRTCSPSVHRPMFQPPNQSGQGCSSVPLKSSLEHFCGWTPILVLFLKDSFIGYRIPRCQSDSFLKGVFPLSSDLCCFWWKVSSNSYLLPVCNLSFISLPYCFVSISLCH